MATQIEMYCHISILRVLEFANYLEINHCIDAKSNRHAFVFLVIKEA